MLRQKNARFETRAGFSVGVLVTTPPFPYTRKDVAEPIGMPILFDGKLSRKDRNHLHFGEVGMEDGELVTSGLYGWTMVGTGDGRTIRKAQRKAYDLASRVRIPNMRYRLDIGDNLIDGAWDQLGKLKMLS
jgi:phosphoribosylamine--glycine ligase